jgi:two-component sensor histidine kinase
MLAVVLAVVQLSKKNATSVDAFAETVAGRVRSLASAYDLISDVQWSEVSLRDLALVDLEPFHADQRNRISLDGPRVMTKPKAALAFGMIFHELCTNAVKYGALSNGAGRVTVTWETQQPKDGPVLVLRWRESDGPPVEAPARGGFGTELIKREAQSELKGAVAVEYADGGLEAVFTVPLNPDLLRFDPEKRS